MASIKEVAQGIKQHTVEHFDWRVYGYVALFLVITISINYSVDFEDSILDKSFKTPWGFLFYPLFFAFPYFAIAIPQAYWKRNSCLSNVSFWKKSIAFILLLGFTKAFYFHYFFIESLDDQITIYFVKKIVRHLIRISFYLMVLWILKTLWDKEIKGIYGLSLTRFDYKPYLLMLLCMLPLIAWASFQPAFIKTYPMYKFWYYDTVGTLDSWQSGLIYEVSYAFNFISVELLFRGALVIGMASILGKDAILPMVATYAFLHFGKPMAETIGSILGGYILGIVALQTRSILGGIIIHVGIALAMDIAAYIQHFKSSLF